MRGTVVACGPGLRLSSWPETPSVRATALRPWLNERRIASHLTAAWIWGAARDPGATLEFILHHGTLYDEPLTASIRLKNLRPGANEIELLSGLRVTSPARTLADLIRDRDYPTEHAVACRLLMLRFPLETTREIDRLLSIPRLPHRRRLLARLGGQVAAGDYPVSR